MAKDSVTDYDSVPADNQDIGGVAILGTSPRSNFDNAFRELMSQLADAWAGTAPVFDTFTYGDPADLTKRFRFDAGSVTAGQTRVLTAPNFDGTMATLAGTETLTNKTLTAPIINGGTFTDITATFATSATITATNDGASAGPILDLYRISASPAASDSMGQIQFNGRDSAGNKQNYAYIEGGLIDPTSTSEDGSIRLGTTVAGTSTDRAYIVAGLFMPGAGGDPGAGKINATELQANGVKVGITAGTAQASTSGTSIDFTSIPAGVKRVTIMLSAVSISSTSNWLFQIGDSGGIESSGYVSGSGISFNSAGSAVSSTSGFILGFDNAANTVTGSLVITNFDGNTWVAAGSFGSVGGFDGGGTSGGTKTLSGTLDRVRVTTVSGVATFDAGSINILYE